MGLVLDFGGETREAVYVAFLRIAVPRQFKVLLLPSEDEENLRYREFHGGLEEALEHVSEGHCSSLQVEGYGASPFLAGLYRPRFAGQLLADWSASVEGRELDSEALFRELQGIDGLGYIAVFTEESADIEAEHTTETTFPWNDWRLVAGAVRAADGKWIVRKKPHRMRE